MNTMTKSILITRLTEYRAAACLNRAGLFALAAARIYIGKIGGGLKSVDKFLSLQMSSKIYTYLA